jgi:hypothetical protein
MDDNRPKRVRALDQATLLELVSGHQCVLMEPRTCGCGRSLVPRPQIEQGVRWACPTCEPDYGGETEMNS